MSFKRTLFSLLASKFAPVEQTIASAESWDALKPYIKPRPQLYIYLYHKLCTHRCVYMSMSAYGIPTVRVPPPPSRRGGLSNCGPYVLSPTVRVSLPPTWLQISQTVGGRPYPPPFKGKGGGWYSLPRTRTRPLTVRVPSHMYCGYGGFGKGVYELWICHIY